MGYGNCKTDVNIQRNCTWKLVVAILADCHLQIENISQPGTLPRRQRMVDGYIIQTDRAFSNY